MATDLRKLLKRLQQDVRTDGPSDTSPYGRGGSIPEHLATPEASWLRVGPETGDLINQVTAILLDDEHYEHLADKADATVWEFVCKSVLNRGSDHVKAFLQDYNREPQSFTLSFSVDHLTVVVPEAIGDVVLLPLPDEATSGGQHLRRDASAGCMAQVVVTGTDARRATERGRERARHALSLFRVSLASVQMLNEQQLRFRLGQMYLSGDNLQGFQRHEDAAFDADFSKPLDEIFPNRKRLDIPFAGGTEIQNRLALAVSWVDAAYMDVSPIHRVGFLFTALEAMLGDSAEGLKAPALVFYRTALGHLVQGGFPDPHRLYYLYDQIRSYATHGEAVPDVAERDINYLNWNIQETLMDLLSFCKTRNLTSRKQVREELVKDGVGELTLNYLRSTGPREWWENWSPGPKPSRSQREKELSAEVETLNAKIAALRDELGVLRAQYQHDGVAQQTSVD